MKKNKVAPIVDRAHDIWGAENDDDYPRILGELVRRFGGRSSDGPWDASFFPEIALSPPRRVKF